MGEFGEVFFILLLSLFVPYTPRCLALDKRVSAFHPFFRGSDSLCVSPKFD